MDMPGSAPVVEAPSQVEALPPPVEQPAVSPVEQSLAEVAITPPPPVVEPTPPPVPVAAPALTAVPGRLIIKASNVSLPIPPGKTTIVIGREDPVSAIFPDIDLDPHGGLESGVGRQHAQITLQSGSLFVEDLSSVNGSYLNRQRIPPRQPEALHDGDEIRLGKLVLVYAMS
jgi:pSer/pThr/pTyr-binding forkhead associated (FHA) protein